MSDAPNEQPDFPSHNLIVHWVAEQRDNGETVLVDQISGRVVRGSDAPPPAPWLDHRGDRFWLRTVTGVVDGEPVTRYAVQRLAVGPDGETTGGVYETYHTADELRAMGWTPAWEADRD